jgi:membrane protein
MVDLSSRGIDYWKERIGRVPVIGVLVRAAVMGRESHAKDMAASIAFFSFLSLFPLLLGLVALVSSVLKSEALKERIMSAVNEFFPVGAGFVTDNIDSLVRLRGAAGIASVLVLLWSARKMVGAISRGINLALRQQRNIAIFLSPLRNFGLVLGVTLLMFASTAVTPVLDVLVGQSPGWLPDAMQNRFDMLTSQLISTASTAALILVTYLLVPFERPAWRQVWPGLLTATLLIELGKKVFVYYVENVSRLDAVYGSISTVIVLLLWLYFFGRVLLYGAEVMFVRRPKAKTAADKSRTYEEVHS